MVEPLQSKRPPVEFPSKGTSGLFQQMLQPPLLHSAQTRKQPRTVTNNYMSLSKRNWRLAVSTLKNVLKQPSPFCPNPHPFFPVLFPEPIPRPFRYPSVRAAGTAPPAAAGCSPAAAARCPWTARPCLETAGVYQYNTGQKKTTTASKTANTSKSSQRHHATV